MFKQINQIVFSIMMMTLLVMPAQAAIEDPTRPPGMNMVTTPSDAIKSGPRWVLTSTLVSAGRRTAVINDRVVSKGDRVNGATVIDIQPSRVRLSASGRDVTLVMLKRNVKTPSRQPKR